MNARATFFIHTNHKQMLGALVGAHAARLNTRHADRFDVRIIAAADHPWLAAREGEAFLRDGDMRVWRMEDLQSFTPLRFTPPELMGYQGRAVVTDPDVFALGDVWELLDRDMGGKAFHARRRTGAKARDGWASSVMLLDCARLTHWRAAESFDAMFRRELDYMDWISLRGEDAATVGALGDDWNAFDRLTPETKMIHNTKRHTQPWKSGLPADFTAARKSAKLGNPMTWGRPLARLFGAGTTPARYARHPDPRQEELFFSLLKSAVGAGEVSEDFLRAEMGRNHLRHDALELLDRAAPYSADAVARAA